MIVLVSHRAVPPDEGDVSSRKPVGHGTQHSFLEPGLSRPDVKELKYLKMRDGCEMFEPKPITASVLLLLLRKMWQFAG